MSKKSKDNSVKIEKESTFKGDTAIGKGAKIIKNIVNVPKKKESTWNKLGVIIAGIVLLFVILAFLEYDTISDFFTRPVILLTMDNQSAIVCRHDIPEFNSSEWVIMEERLPEGFDISNYDDYKIDPVLYYPWGFILTITREKDIDVIEPNLVISYNKPNFFYNAYLSSGLIAPKLDIKPKVYDGTSEPRRYNTTESLPYHLNSPYKTTVYLPDLTKDNPKITVAVTFLVDLNHDCKKDFPISFKITEETHKIETEEKISLLRVVEI